MVDSMTHREKAAALLAEALHAANGSACLHEDGYGGTGWVQCDKAAAWTLECSPALAAALELGVAWQMAEAALPEGWAVNLLWGTITEERWGANAGPFPAKAGYSGITAGGSTPDEALAALATALVNGSAGADDTEGAAK